MGKQDDILVALASPGDRDAMATHLRSSLLPPMLDTYTRFKWTTPAQTHIALEQVNGEDERVVLRTPFEANAALVAELVSRHYIFTERMFFTSASPYPSMHETRGMTARLDRIQSLASPGDRDRLGRHLDATHPSRPEMNYTSGRFRLDGPVIVEEVAGPAPGFSCVVAQMELDPNEELVRFLASEGMIFDGRAEEEMKRRKEAAQLQNAEGTMCTLGDGDEVA